MENESVKLHKLIQLGLEFAEISDLDVLLEKVLLASRQFVNADAGSIYIKDNDKLNFSYSQNDTLSNRLEPGKKLIYSTFSIPINRNSISGYVASTGELLNLEDMYSLPPGLPFSFNKQIDIASSYHTQSMITVPMKTNRGKIIGVLQLINAKDVNNNIVSFSSEDETYIKHFANTAATAIERAQLTRTTILRMISMAELRDPKETGTHVNRVAAYSLEIYETWARKKGIPEKEIDAKRDTLRIAAMLHDVGKVAISDTILKKPAKFTDEEFAIMKTHTIHGARLFSDSHSEFDELSMQVALNHHERWDGRGYPGYIDLVTLQPLEGHIDENGKAKGKVGEEIPVVGRVVAIADVYDALSSQRVYKEAWTEDNVLETIRQSSGTQFDAEMIDAFFESLDVLRSIAQRYKDNK